MRSKLHAFRLGALLMLAAGGAALAQAGAAGPKSGAAASADASQSGSVAATVDTSGHFQARTGEGLYTSLCQGCHMPNAKGAVGAGAYPALAGDERLVSGDYVAALVLQGRKAMPGFAGNLSDDQVAAVATYVRSHFGNAFPDAVTPAMVKTIRDAGDARSSHANQAG